MRTSRIDTHQHLAFKDRFQYPWMTRTPPLDSDQYRLEDYWREAAGHGIAGTVFMETEVAEDCTIMEAAHACQLASDPSSRILGVVASARLDLPDFAAQLEPLSHPRLAGIRSSLHTQPDELSAAPVFRRNLDLLGKAGLPFELCVLQRQLPLAADLVRACPGTTFVLDHCGVPDIAANDAPLGGGWRSWKAAISRLAAEPNVHCKLSGLPAYADPSQRTPAGLRPYVETVITAFGWGRVLWGSDWPVCNLGGGLARWIAALDEILAGESASALHRLYEANARSVYRLTI